MYLHGLAVNCLAVKWTGCQMSHGQLSGGQTSRGQMSWTPRRALPIYLFIHVCCRMHMYRLTAMNTSQADRQKERQTDGHTHNIIMPIDDSTARSVRQAENCPGMLNQEPRSFVNEQIKNK